jgi:hypothetical protein
LLRGEWLVAGVERGGMHTVHGTTNKGGNNANNSEGSTIPLAAKRRWHQVAKSQAQLFNLREEKKIKKKLLEL